MSRVVVFAFLIAGLMWGLAPSAVRAQEDFATFIQQNQDNIMTLHEDGMDHSSSIAQTLDVMRKRATEEPASKERYEALRWMIAQYKQVGQAGVAASLCETLAADKNAPATDLPMLLSQEAQLYAATGNSQKSAAALSSVLTDPQIANEDKTQLVASTLTTLMDNHAWAGAQKVGEQALELGLGNPRDLYMAVGKSAMQAGDYTQGTKAYETLRSQYAADLNPVGLLECDKDLLVCHKEGKVDTVEYLTDLTALLDRYKADPAANARLGGILLDEYGTLAQGWLGVVEAYGARGEPSPVTAEWAREKSLQISKDTYEALDALPLEDQRKMPNYQAPLMKACFAAVESLTASSRTAEAQALLERLKAKIPADHKIYNEQFNNEVKFVADAEAKAKQLANATPTPAATATPATRVKATPGHTAAPTPAAAAQAAATSAETGGMGTGTMVLVVVLLGAAVLLLVLATRKPKTQK